ncbi:MAG: hypothetical protein KDK51_06870 [Deltaproteobacteria bacterium]|nr:hypothetical protein [Deltaproteobacteria bacterium]
MIDFVNKIFHTRFVQVLVVLVLLPGLLQASSELQVDEDLRRDIHIYIYPEDHNTSACQQQAKLKVNDSLCDHAVTAVENSFFDKADHATGRPKWSMEFTGISTMDFLSQKNLFGLERKQVHAFGSIAFAHLYVARIVQMYEEKFILPERLRVVTNDAMITTMASLGQVSAGARASFLQSFCAYQNPGNQYVTLCEISEYATPQTFKQTLLSNLKKQAQNNSLQFAKLFMSQLAKATDELLQALDREYKGAYLAALKKYKGQSGYFTDVLHKDYIDQLQANQYTTNWRDENVSWSSLLNYARSPLRNDIERNYPKSFLYAGVFGIAYRNDVMVQHVKKILTLMYEQGSSIEYQTVLNLIVGGNHAHHIKTLIDQMLANTPDLQQVIVSLEPHC